MADTCRLVVATNAFGMGIDKSDVRLVAHVQLPFTLEAYYQEAGRAGRDGDQADCVAFYALGDRRRSRAMLSHVHPPLRSLRRALRQLRSAADGRGVVSPETALRDRRGRSLPDEELSGLLGALGRLDVLRFLDSGSGAPGTESATRVSLRVLRKGAIDLSPAAVQRRRVLAKFLAVQLYARGRACRRRALLRYLGEDAADDWGSCDRCGRPPNNQ